MTLCAALRFRLDDRCGQATGALAAYERDDQPTICERAPRRLPVRRGNRLAVAKQTSDDALHTSRTGLVLSGSANVVRAVMGASARRRLHMFPLCVKGWPQAAAHPAAGTESPPHRNLSADPF